LPYSTGNTRQCAPDRANHKIASTNNRLSLPVRPGSLALPGRCASIRDQTASLSSRSIHADLHPSTQLESQSKPIGNPECQRNLGPANPRDLVSCAIVARATLGTRREVQGLETGILFVSQARALTLSRQLADQKLRGFVRVKIRPDGVIRPIDLEFRPRTRG